MSTQTVCDFEDCKREFTGASIRKLRVISDSYLYGEEHDLDFCDWACLHQYATDKVHARMLENKGE